MKPALFPSLHPLHWILPGLVLAAITGGAWLLDLDRTITGYFYDPAGAVAWPTGERVFWRFLYRWGELPAVLLAVGAVVLVAQGMAFQRATPRRAGIFLLVCLLVGPLLVTNGALKGLYGRPRPTQVVDFGGGRPFQPVGLPTLRRDENGFPSGHAAAGFAMLLPYFLLRGRSRRLANRVLVAGLVYGGLMGFARMAQGGHFLSDVSWSGGVVYFTGYGLARWQAARPPPEEDAPAQREQTGRTGRTGRAVVWGLAGLVCLLLLVGYLARMPVDVTREWVVRLRPGDLKARIVFVTEKGRPRITDQGPLDAIRLRLTARGRGFPFAPLREVREATGQGSGEVTLRYTLVPGWGVTHLVGRLRIDVPPGVEAEAVVQPPARN